MRACDGPLTADTLYLYPTALKAEAVLHDRAGAAGALLAHRVTTFPELTDALARELDGAIEHASTAVRVRTADDIAVLSRRLDGSATTPGVRRSRRFSVAVLPTIRPISSPCR